MKIRVLFWKKSIMSLLKNNYFKNKFKKLDILYIKLKCEYGYF